MPSYLLSQEWSSDSAKFAFQNPQVGVETWFNVDVSSHQLTETTTYPLSPLLSEAEIQVFQTQDVIRVSPDGQLLLYAIEAGKSTTTEGERLNLSYALANRSTQQVVTMAIPAANVVNTGNSVNVVWSDDSSGIAMSVISLDGAIPRLLRGNSRPQ